MPSIISSLAPIVINGTVLATQSVTLEQGVRSQTLGQSGLVQQTHVLTSGGRPQVTCQIPWKSAYDLMGLAPLAITSLDVFLTTFSGAIVAPTLSHTKWALASGASGFAAITGWSVGTGGVCYASVTIVLLSGDGVTDPMEQSDNNTLPTLAAQPSLHTLGPIKINGTVIGGSTNHSGSTGITFTSPDNDGDLYPRVAAALTAAHEITVTHSDPITLLDALGLLGDDITSDFVAYFRDYDDTTGVVQATGISLTVAGGRVFPQALSGSHGQQSSSGLRVVALSPDGSDLPIVVGLSATIPAIP